MNKTQNKKPVINPFETLDKITHPIPHSGNKEMVSSLFKEIPTVGDNATKIDFDKLNTSYADQDKGTLEEIKKNLNPEQQAEMDKVRFFKRYKQEEQEYYERRKREDEEKRQREELEEQERKRQEEEERLAKNAGQATPQGKKKKSIFGKIKDKANMILPPEMKPGGGKQ